MNVNVLRVTFLLSLAERTSVIDIILFFEEAVALLLHDTVQQANLLISLNESYGNNKSTRVFICSLDAVAH